VSRRKLTQSQRRRIDARQQSHNREPSALDGLELHAGLVLTQFGKLALVESEDNEAVLRCHLRANLTVVAGDKVLFRRDGDNSVIETRDERSSELRRPDKFGNLKAVAANVSQMLITIAPQPAPHMNLIDRYLVAAHLHAIAPILVMNKCDLANADEKFNDIEALYRKLNVDIIRVSTQSGLGIEQLEQKLRSHSSIFVGQSGVGKSSLLKTLIAEDSIRIAELSHAEDKGRHTTTQAQVYHLPGGGLCIDSPGIREFGLWHVGAEDLLNAFPDIEKHKEHCKFRDCKHEKEIHCGILAARERGDIDPRRYDSYRQILSQMNSFTVKDQ